MGIIKINSVDQYNQLISSDLVSAVLFSASWAEQCQQIFDVMSDLSAKTDRIQFIDIAAEDFSDISLKHQIEAVPTVIFFKQNKALDRIDGVNIAALTAFCKKVTGSGESTEDLNTRIKSLISKSDLMIFMKGDRNTPKCGFSRTLIGIINETGLPYETFDILTDEDVRQGLKAYSEWPTYPQVYVKSELIGGLDIIKELQASGELVSSLKGE